MFSMHRRDALRPRVHQVHGIKLSPQYLPPPLAQLWRFSRSRLLREIRPLIILGAIFLLPTSDHAAAAAGSFSVRCEGGTPVRPYFATFDIDARAVVFETPAERVDTYSNMNVRPGEITSTGHGDDGKIEFVVRGFDGKIELIFDPRQKTMTWPGVGDPSFRPTLIHRCTITPPRSILSFRIREPVLYPLSVRCEDAGYMYFTMDAASKQAVFERGKEAGLFHGDVTSVSQDEIVLSMNFDVPRRVVWSKSRQTITIEAIEGDPSRPRTVLDCQEVVPRTMIVYHAILLRR